jgi:hypothetical protein
MIVDVGRKGRTLSHVFNDRGFFGHAIKFRTLMAGLPVMHKFGIVSSGDAEFVALGTKERSSDAYELHHQQCMPAQKSLSLQLQAEI